MAVCKQQLLSAFLMEAGNHIQQEVAHQDNDQGVAHQDTQQGEVQEDSDQEEVAQLDKEQEAVLLDKIQLHMVEVEVVDS